MDALDICTCLKKFIQNYGFFKYFTRGQIRAKLHSVKNTLISILNEYFPEFIEVFKNLAW